MATKYQLDDMTRETAERYLDLLDAPFNFDSVDYERVKKIDQALIDLVFVGDARACLWPAKGVQRELQWVIPVREAMHSLAPADHLEQLAILTPAQAHIQAELYHLMIERTVEF